LDHVDKNPVFDQWIIFTALKIHPV